MSNDYVNISSGFQFGFDVGSPNLLVFIGLKKDYERTGSIYSGMRLGTDLVI